MQENNKNTLEKYRQEYESIVMSDDAYRILRLRIEQGKEEKHIMDKKKSIKRRTVAIAAAAAAMALVIIPNTSGTVAYAMGNIPVLGEFFKIVTFRDYQYEDNRHVADINVPAIVIDSDEDITVSETVKDTTEEINNEIQRLTNQWIDEFRANLEGDGYHNVMIKSEVINTTESYFTLKLICYQGAGSGYEEHHYYTIDLKTGEKVKLPDLFKNGSDYKSAISENIKTQMKEQMATDSAIIYWVDNKDFPEWNFKEIKEDTSFYINADGQLVISFNEGEVAPMYMGVVEFTIPNDVIAGMLK